jgi:hypothetical protein
MVELDKKYNPGNSKTELDEDLLNSLPFPICDACKLLENQSDYDKSLQILCLSLIPWTYQYIALIFSGEYLTCKDAPSIEVTDSLLNMVKKPGPGKWIGFTRLAAGYFKDHKSAVISAEAISLLNTVLNSKDQPKVSISGNENKLEYSDALINIRNRFAHSRSIMGDKAKELFLDYFLIWKAWIIIIKDVFEPRLLFRPSSGNSFQSFDNRSFDINRLTPGMNNMNTILWDAKRDSFIMLYPVIVTYSDRFKPNGDVAFLEEIKSRYLFYLQGDNFFKLKEEFDVLSKMIESKTIPEEVVSAENLTIKTFSERIDRITNQTITNFQDSMKYIPEMYLDRPQFTEKLDNWLESNLPGCIIAGNQGTGKTSIITNWCIKRRLEGDHVLLLEASALKESDITMIIGEELNLGSPLKDCLDTIQRQNETSSDEQKGNKFIIVIDAVNEFTGKNNENRGRLWREINSLITILNLYAPRLKCLVTTRSDLWAFDFPGKNSAFDVLKEKLYWGDAENGFPGILLGDLSLSEASEIFEAARKTIPSMAVHNSFDELSEKTKKVLCNPFLLRLALLIYNEREIPNLTRSKIEKQYARERITEEKDKKKVLFTLLERMSELRKTEVTFDEFLYAQTTAKSKKRVSAKEKIDLEKLIFDPRPQSPYKKLIREGILEERADESNLKSKEKIRFSQEKITDIIYTEFSQRAFKKTVKSVILMVLLLLVYLVAVFFSARSDSNGAIKKIQTELSKSQQDDGNLLQITSISANIIKRGNNIIAIRDGLKMIFIYALYIGFTLFIPYVRFLGARIIKNDLPTKFLKEKFTEIKQKKYFYGTIPLFVIIIIALIKFGQGKSFEMDDNIFVFGIPVFLGYTALWDLILGVIIVIKNANSPLDAFCLFGKKEVIQSCINYIPLIPFIILMSFGVPYLVKKKNINSDEKLISLRQEWVSNKAVVSLQNQDPGIYSVLRTELIGSSDNNSIKTDNTAYLTFMKVFIYSICIIYTLMLVLQYYMGYWLFKWLKLRL